jgi:hypothetical protein
MDNVEGATYYCSFCDEPAPEHLGDICYVCYDSLCEEVMVERTDMEDTEDDL